MYKDINFFFPVSTGVNLKLSVNILISLVRNKASKTDNQKLDLSCLCLLLY